MEALIIVDVQKDFCPGGNLPSPEGEKIISVINDLAEKFDVVVASKDNHPPDSNHFEKWPLHCIQGTDGAKFHPKLNTEYIEKVFLKGTTKADDGYSAFDSTENLNSYLRHRKVTDVYIVGLTTEYCIKATAIQSQKIGFNTFIITDAVGAVNPNSKEKVKAIEVMKKVGVTLVHSYQVLNQ